MVNDSGWRLDEAPGHYIVPPLPWRGRRIEAMGKAQRLAWTIVLLCLIVIAVGVFVTAADGLRNIFWSLRSQ